METTDAIRGEPQQQHARVACGVWRTIEGPDAWQPADPLLVLAHDGGEVHVVERELVALEGLGLKEAHDVRVLGMGLERDAVGRERALDLGEQRRDQGVVSRAICDEISQVSERASLE